ncbi:MAG: RsmD family RNA methyltransferase, partial [Vallitaleaceae bacterium]|nr:RsmD family RNA methyltransferase [Vallitaleaceae bacterium]
DSIEIIKKNLEHTKLVEKAKVLQYDYIRALQRMSEGQVCFDLVFLDPPYEQGFEKESLQRIDEYGLMNPKGIIVVESSLSTPVEEVGSLRIYKEKIFKTNKFTFFEAVNEEDR